MLGPIGSEIMNIFRLLSPDEIDRYIVDEKTSIMVGSVAAGGESLSLDTEDSHHGQYSKKKKKFAKDHQAEIIPLSEHKEKQAAKQFLEENDRYPEQENELSRENVEAKAKKVAESTHDLSSIGVLSASSIREIENERLKKDIFSIAPGISGLGQVLGYDMSDPVKLSKIDALYISNKNIKLDLKIFIATFFKPERKSLMLRFKDQIKNIEEKS